MSKRQLPTSEHASPVDRALEKAVLALQMQRFEEAERVASQVLKSNRGSVPAACILGRALLAQKRADEAIDVLQRAARRSGDPELKPCLPWPWRPPDDAARPLSSCSARPRGVHPFRRHSSNSAASSPTPDVLTKASNCSRAASRLRQIASI